MIISPPAINHSLYSINSDSPPTNNEVADAPIAIRTKRGIADKYRLWPQNSTITIAFMDTSPAHRALIQKHIEKNYAHLINLKLNFVEGTQGDIRISTSAAIAGDWSVVGTGALTVPANEPTMHLDPQNTEDIFKMNILHEFGHALGLRHEHKHPDRTLEFNLPKIYKLYMQQFNLDKIDVYEQILQKLNPADIIASDYDQKSIMHYNLSRLILWKQQSTGYNFNLSNADKALLQSIYPRPKPGAVPVRRPR
ncbi:M12 family metallopeptidase [Pseudomonas sp. L1(2025)]|uniref:M12 family metallopeptidase n=1 Tax=Pseudomonas sp. L1(2025) TaxID=3449429 RepID=UPI003F68C712